MTQTNIIELNGKRYDAQTGAMLGKSHASTVRPASLRAHQGRAIDGFIRPDHQAAQAQIAKAHVASKVTVAAPKPTHVHADITPTKKRSTARTGVKPLAAHQPQKSKILMRHAVHKPNFTMKTPIKTQAPAEMMAKPVGTIVPKLSAYRLDPRRVGRAQAVARSPHIQRFATAKAAAQMQPGIAVVRHPAGAHHAAPQSTRANLGHPAIRPSIATHTHQRPAKSDMFESAIAHATSHMQPAAKAPRRAHHRWFKIGAGMAVVLAIGLGALWFNRTNIQVYLASNHVGFHVSLPSYAPDGYTLTGGIEASNGKVTLSFHSGDSHYTLTQQASSWDSATLRASMVALATGNPQILQAAGRTVYIYGHGDATWVDGGVRYNLATDNSLSTQEITNLAASI